MTKKIVFNTLGLLSVLSLLSCQSMQKNKSVSVVELIKQGKTDEAKQCFESKYDINETDEEGNSALHLAAAQNDASLTLFLLCYGADPDLKNLNSQTPLHVAIENNAREAAGQLVSFGCNIFARNGDGLTAIDMAFELDPAYYDIFITTKTGEIRDAETAKTIVHYFVEKRNIEAVVCCIQKGIPISVKDNNGETPLAYA